MTIYVFIGGNFYKTFLTNNFSWNAVCIHIYICELQDSKVRRHFCFGYNSHYFQLKSATNELTNCVLDKR